jgi:hypothetical protein
VSRRWSHRGLAALGLAAAVWIGFGTGVYVYLGAHRGALSTHAQKPGEGRPRKDGPINHLPGTLYLVQDGTLYQLQHGTFTAILNSPGGSGGWTQPAVSPNGQSLLVVRRDYAFSDLYQVDATGHTQNQLTHNASKTVELNHWAFYPRFTPDGGSIAFTYDAKDRFNNYNVVLSVYQMPVGGAFTQAKKWTTPNSYTGGDLQPVPLRSGGMIYTKYSFDQPTGRILGQLWLTTKAGTPGRALTPAGDDCSQPSLSSDGQRLAMICTAAKQFADIEVASFDGTNLGPRETLVTGQLASQPTWAPDGSSLVYLAPHGASGHFQLWLQPLPQPPPPPATPSPAGARSPSSLRGARVAQAPSPSPSLGPPAPTPTPTPLPAPVQLTPDNDFDATSTIAWHA